MDTGTHFMIGLGLGGLAMLDPVFSAHPESAAAVLIGTVAGSNAPDLDMLAKMKGNAAYIRHHRGISHSLPAIPVWTGLITLLLSLIFRGVPWPHFAFWVGLSVIIHILTDLCNSYGTQALWPIRKEWIRWNLLPVFDPFLFASHLLAIFLWGVGAVRPQAIFPLLYVLLAGYFAWRTLLHARLGKSVPLADSQGRRGDRYTLLPTASPYRWNVVRRSKDGLHGIGEWESGKLRWLDMLTCDTHPAAEASKALPDVQAFLGIAPFPCASVKERSWGYEVRWEDIRYRHGRQYPFVAVVLMDLACVPLQSYVGWLSVERLEKRLRMSTY